MKASVFQIPLLTLTVSLLLALPWAAAQEAGGNERPVEPTWTLIHGNTTKYGELDLERIGAVYLRGKKWQKVAAEDADLSEIEGPLFVVGNLDDNLIAQALTLPALGSSREYMNRSLEPGIGLIYGGRRGNGQPFCVFTGLDDTGVFQCFTTSVNVSAAPNFVIEGGKILVNWVWPEVEARSEDAEAAAIARRPLVHDPASAALRILDPRSTLVQPGLSRAERAELAARIMAGYGEERQLMDRVDWLPAVEVSRRRMVSLQSRTSSRLEEVLDWTRDRPLALIAERIYRELEDRFGVGQRPAPAVFLLLDSPQVTNARTVGIDRTTGRPRVVMNLACFPTEKSFRIALVHEYLHCLQLDEAGTLPDDPMLVEGVAVLLSQAVLPECTAAEVLMWTDAHYQAAERLAEPAAAKFREQWQAGRDRNRWFILGESIFMAGQNEEGRQQLPDRMGYYLGYQAARAWRQANPDAPLREMLHLQAGALLDFMPDKVRILESAR